jgi:hypothetical protein
MNRRSFATLIFIVGTGAAAPVWAGAYKCRQPDGSIAYQDAACAGEATGEEVKLEPSPSGQDKPRRKAKDYSIEGQVKAIEAERRKAHQGRSKSGTDRPRSDPSRDDRDRAKCAKERAETARWHQAARGTYRDRDEQEYREQTLAYHQALVKRYCGGP